VQVQGAGLLVLVLVLVLVLLVLVLVLVAMYLVVEAASLVRVTGAISTSDMEGFVTILIHPQGTAPFSP
jgi:hypothetical protein